MIVLATGGRQQVQAGVVGGGADPPAPSQDRRHAGGAVLCYRQARIDRKIFRQICNALGSSATKGASDADLPGWAVRRGNGPCRFLQ